MPEHKIGSREEWKVARAELAKLEAEQAKQNEEVTKARRDLPWVKVEKEYEFDTQDGKKSLADLFEGRSQLDRKSTRLNSSHSQISYAAFCLKKKKTDDPLRS